LSRFRADCPQCGAQVEYGWSSSVQTTCEYCRSILVRRDIDVERVGQTADLPLEVSPIQIRTEGIFEKRAFTVAGRIVYEWDGGGWNEWHLMFQDGKSGWLSDAQAEYFVSFAAKAPPKFPSPGELGRGERFEFEGRSYEVAVITRANYLAVEGELPFEYWDKERVFFADLRTPTGHFATIDYSEKPPLLFLGRAVEFDELRLKNLREFEGW
jgi:hypothetical protein